MHSPGFMDKEEEELLAFSFSDECRHIGNGLIFITRIEPEYFNVNITRKVFLSYGWGILAIETALVRMDWNKSLAEEKMPQNPALRTRISDTEDLVRKLHERNYARLPNQDLKEYARQFYKLSQAFDAIYYSYDEGNAKLPKQATLDDY